MRAFWLMSRKTFSTGENNNSERENLKPDKNPLGIRRKIVVLERFLRCLSGIKHFEQSVANSTV